MEALRRLALSALLFAAAAQGKERLAAGDRTHAAPLFELHCLGCHGAAAPTAVGKSLGAPSLRDSALLATRTDDQLLKAILDGSPSAGMPAFARWLTVLDAADIVALLRAPVLTVDDVFESAAAYTAKRYTIEASQLARAEALADGTLSPEERSITVFSVYGGQVPPLGPSLVPPDDHVQLDGLSPKQKLGYVVFGTVPAGKRELPIGLSMSPAYTVLRVVGPKGSAGELRALSSAAVGKGGREPGKRRPFASRAAPEQAKALTRLYARAVEAALLAAREEADRHLFDPPEPAKAASKPADSAE